MDAELKHIKQLLNSKDNQNLYIGYWMLKNYKEWFNGEFEKAFKEMFFSTFEYGQAARERFYLHGESIISVLFHKYSLKGKGKVFLYRITANGKTIGSKKAIQMRSFHEYQSEAFLKIANFIENNLETTKEK